MRCLLHSRDIIAQFKQFIFILLASLSLCVPCQGRCLADTTQHITTTDTITHSPQRLFNKDSILELTIHTSLKRLTRDIGENRKYHKAQISYKQEDGTIISLKALLRTRGDFRKNRSICSFPPLRVKFDPNNVNNTIFEGQKKLKMVTHCQTRSKRHVQMLMQEYLIYKAYNLFTPESFHVRLARITYHDTEVEDKQVTKFGFFIEDAKAMAARNHKVLVKRMRIHQDATNIYKITLLSVFQYLIGNTDWGVPTLHNIKLIANSPTSQPVAVPYDFDWAALVNAPYAIPQEVLEIKSIHERIYRGYERSSKDLEFIFHLFREKKQQLYDIYITCPYLSDKEKERILNYFDEFYETINDPKKVKREFIFKSRKYKYR